MPKYRFQITSSIDVIVECEYKDDGRMMVIENLERGEYDLVGPHCCISDGEEAP